MKLIEIEVYEGDNKNIIQRVAINPEYIVAFFQNEEMLILQLAFMPPGRNTAYFRCPMTYEDMFIKLKNAGLLE